jgi:hypothetical protein
MSEIVFMRRKLGSLRPIDPTSAEILERIPQDEDVKVEITRPRNVRHHRKFFALLNAIYPHQDTYPTRDSFRAAISTALGFGETVKLPDGRTIIIPHSISFAKMDQSAFEQFYDRAVLLIMTRILPGVNRADLDREVADILAGRDEPLSAAARAGEAPNKASPEAVA